MDYFIAHAGPDKPIAMRVRDLLETHGARVFVDSMIPPGDDWDTALAQTLDTAAATLALISVHTAAAHYQRAEIARAITLSRQRPNGHRIVPIYLEGEPRRAEDIPYGLETKNHLAVTPTFPLEAVIQRLLERTDARSASPKRAQPLFPWPNRVVRRDLRACREALICLDPGHTVSLVGPGGFGKTTMAAMLGHDEEVGKSFGDGVYWATLGQSPQTLEVLDDLYTKITGTAAGSLDERGYIVALEEAMCGKRVLVIIDDAWTRSAVETVLRATSAAARLVTTRDRTLVQQSIVFDVGELEHKQAISLLAGDRTLNDGEAAAASGLVEQLGGWALLLELAAKYLDRRLADGMQFLDAVHDLESRFATRGARAFDARRASSREEAIRLSIDASLEILDARDREAYLKLFIVPKSVVIPLEAAADLWGMDQYDADDLLTDLNDRSLLRYNTANRRASLHDVVRDELTRREPNVSEVHDALLRSWDLRRPKHEYAWRHVGYHLVKANRQDDLQRLLCDATWLLGKTRAVGLASLLEDFARIPAKSPELGLIRDALALSASVISQNPDELPSQLYGRMLAHRACFPDLLDSIGSYKAAPWLKATVTALSSPGGPLRTILRGHTDWVTTVVVADLLGRPVIASGSRDKTLRVWDLLSGAEIMTLSGHSGEVTVLASCEIDDRPCLVSGSRDSTLRVWDLGTGKERNVFKGHKGDILALFVCEIDGRPITVSGSADSTVRVWDLMSSNESHVFRGHLDIVSCLSSTMIDGAPCAVSGSADGTARIWNLVSGSEVATLSCYLWRPRPEFGSLIRHVIPIDTADGPIVVTSSDGGNVNLWRAPWVEFKTLMTSRTISAPSLSAYWRDQTPCLLATSEVGFSLWILGSEVEAVALEAPSSLEGERFLRSWVTSIGGKAWVLAATWDVLYAWELESKEDPLVLSGHSGLTQDAVFRAGPTGPEVITAASDSTVRVWQLRSRGSAGTAVSGGGDVFDVATVQVGTELLGLTVGRDKSVRVWEMSSGECRHVLLGHNDRIHVIAASSDGSLAISGSADRSARVWNLNPPRERFLLAGHNELVDAVSFAEWSGRRYAITGSWDCTVRIWDMSSGRQQAILKGHKGWVCAIATCAIEGRLHVVTGSHDRTVRSWDLDSGKELFMLTGHGDIIRELCTCTLKGRPHAVSVSNDSTVRVWDLAAKKPGPVLTGHVGVIPTLVLCELDGRTHALTGCEDRTVRVWDLESGTVRAVLRGHSGLVWRVDAVHTEQGPFAVSAADDGSIRLWNLVDFSLISCFSSDNPLRSVKLASGHPLRLLAGGHGGAVHILELVR